MSPDLIKLAIHIRRYTRDPKVIDLCDGVIESTPWNKLVPIVDPELAPPSESDAKFDKKAYQREYMRKRRAAK